MPTVALTGTDSPSTTSYVTPGVSFYIYSMFQVPLGRAMANGSRNIYVISLNLYVAGRSGTTSVRAYFAGSPRGSYFNAGAQATPSKKILSVGSQANGGGTFQYGCYWAGGQGGLNFRRGGSGSTQSSGSSSWGSSLSGTMSYAEAPPAPSPIGADQATATSLRARFSNAGDGGSKITGWVLQYSKNSNMSGAKTVTSTGSSTITGLTPNTTYYFRAAGKNIVTDNAGTNGPWSSVFSGKTLASTPTAPRNLKRANSGASASKLTWQAPSNNGGSSVTGYQVQYANNQSFTSPTTSSVGNVLTWTSPSLGIGTWYFRVRAVNANGNGTWSNVVSNTVTRSGHPKVRDEDSFVKKPAKVYLNGSWVIKPVKVRKGKEWITLL